MLVALRQPCPSHVRARDTNAREKPSTEAGYIQTANTPRLIRDRWSNSPIVRKTMETANAAPERGGGGGNHAQRPAGGREQKGAGGGGPASSEAVNAVTQRRNPTTSPAPWD